VITVRCSSCGYVFYVGKSLSVRRVVKCSRCPKCGKKLNLDNPVIKVEAGRRG